MSVIAIEGMEFHAGHGCFEEERITGNRFIVDVYLDADTSVSEQSDRLCDTLDYQVVYETVRKEMMIPSNLLEHAGRRILNAIESKFPQAQHIRLKITKTNPSLGGKVDRVTLTLP